MENLYEALCEELYGENVILSMAKEVDGDAERLITTNWVGFSCECYDGEYELTDSDCGSIAIRECDIKSVEYCEDDETKDIIITKKDGIIYIISTSML